MAEKIIIRLVIVSDSSSSDELEQHIGMKADRSWAKGEVRPRTMIRESMSGWMIALETMASIPLDDAVEKLLERIAHVFECIAEIEECAKQLSIIVYCSQPPALNLSSKTVSKLSRLKASIDIDIYVSCEQTISSNTRPEVTN